MMTEEMVTLEGVLRRRTPDGLMYFQPEEGQAEWLAFSDCTAEQIMGERWRVTLPLWQARHKGWV